MTFQGADGHDNSAGLAEFDPQPMFTGITFPEFVYGANIAYSRGSMMCSFNFNNVLPTVYAAQLAILGATVSYLEVYREVTIKIPGYDRITFSNFNALFIHRRGIDTDWDLGKYVRVTFNFIMLELIV